MVSLRLSSLGCHQQKFQVPRLARNIYFSAVKGRKMHVSGSPPWATEHAWGSFPGAGEWPRGKTWTELNWKKRAFSGPKNGRFWGVLGRFWGVFGAFWGVLGRFWAFWGVFWAFLGVYAGPKNATPFFWPELNWTERTTWQVQIFLTWTELNWIHFTTLISVQFRIQVSFIWKSHLSSGPWTILALNVFLPVS